MPTRSITLFLFAVSRLVAENLSILTVDGLSRPIPGVEVTISCESTKPKNISLITDKDGMVRSTYDPAVCRPISVSVSKEGYQAYSTGFRSRYVVQKQVSAESLLPIVELEGENQIRSLREFLAGDVSRQNDQFRNSLLFHEARLRPALRALVRDPDLTESVRRHLSLIGVTEDLQLILHAPPPPESGAFAERWRYPVAAALVNPETEDEWTFLRRCALNEFEDHWVDAGAIQSLMLNASSRSRKILEEAQPRNQFQARRIARALEYIASDPTPLVGASLESLAARVAQLIKLGNWQGNGVPRFNQAGDKALVDFKFQASMDFYVYTATFHLVDGGWTLRGVRETMQAFAPAFPAPVKLKK